MSWLDVRVSIKMVLTVRVSVPSIHSVYFMGLINRTERATAAPVIRQLFSSSPRDPRYHMLSYISHRFSEDIRPKTHEPRAALFLNRFSRTSTIMYATNGLADILGITADQLNGKSFYYCIQENCLADAVKCLESAKANDSIAYLRFWFRDPREVDRADGDIHMDGNSSGDDDDGGVHLNDRMDEDGSEQAVTSNSSMSQAGSTVDPYSMDRSPAEPDPRRLAPNQSLLDHNSRSSSGNSTDLQDGANDAIFDQPATRQSSSSSLSFNTPDDSNRDAAVRRSHGNLQVEIEAVISCTSDGLVVVLRRARALVPQISGAPVQRSYTNGCFASPWATDPIMPNLDHREHGTPDKYQPGLAPRWPTVSQADTASMRGPDQEDFMNSIREVAVFAWSLTGINGSLARYGRGRPTGQSLPPGGLPIWKPDFANSAELDRHPHHGNNPQETRQHQNLGRVNGSYFSSANNDSHERPNGNKKDAYGVVSNGQGRIQTSHHSPSNGNLNHQGDVFRQAAKATRSSANDNHSHYSYTDHYPNTHSTNLQAQYNDWYQQGLDSGHDADYRNYSLKGQSHTSHNAFNDSMDGTPYASRVHAPQNSFPGGFGHALQDRPQLYIESTMDTKDTQTYLNEGSSNNGYYSGSGGHQRPPYRPPYAEQRGQS